MERRGFLKALGILAASSLIPKKALPIVEKIEEKTKPKGIGSNPYNFKLADRTSCDEFVNYMTIQRKTTTVTGQAIKQDYYYGK